MSFSILVVDEHDRPLDVHSSEEVWQKGLWHRIVRIMIEDRQGRLLLQKRSAKMDLYPGAWDHSAAGHVDEGETYEDGAARELAEETGLRDIALKELSYWQSQKTVHGRILNRFNKLYRGILDSNQLPTPQQAEVDELRWFTRDEAKALAAEHPELVTDGLQGVLKNYY